MNFSTFEKSNLGYHVVLKDINTNDDWIKSDEVIKINDIEVKLWREHYDLPTYRAYINIMLFGGQCRTIVLFEEVDSVEAFQNYFKTIFNKIKP